jgi:hypothetical protein
MLAKFSCAAETVKANKILDVLLTVQHGTSMNQHQLDILSFVCLIKSQCLYIFRALVLIHSSD